MAVPNIFATATSSIPLSQLDTNFATAITLGSTALYLGNTTTSVAGLTITGGAFNGTVGATTPSTGAFTTGTFSSTLAVTGITTVAAGSAALPAIVSTTGTADTGLWFPGADAIAASTSGVEALRITSAGNVGIGVTSVAAKLDVGSLSSTPAIIRLTSNTTGAGAGDGCRLDNYSTTNAGASYQLGLTEFDRADGTGTSSFFAVRTRVSGTVAERMRIDSSGNMLVTNVAGLGYGTGAGGTVTQATDKSTAVTLNKPCGTITMNGAALGGLTTVTFTLNNSILAAADTITVNLNSSSGNFVNYTLQASAWSAGTVIIKLRNDTVGSLSDAVQFNFNIHKGATS